MVPTNDATRYEIILEGPNVSRVRVPLWVPAKTRANIQRAVAPNYDRVLAYVGKKRAAFLWNAKLHAFATKDGYVIRYSGRTERECQESLLPLLPQEAVNAR